MPDSDFIRRLCDEFDKPLALTSANLSGQPSSVKIDDFEELWRECSIVFDGGEIIASNRGSTVVDLSKNDEFRILRAGDGLQHVLDQMDLFSLRQVGNT